MSQQKFGWLKQRTGGLAWFLMLAIAATIAWFTQAQWLPSARSFGDYLQNKKPTAEQADHDSHAGHDDHAHAETGADTLALTSAAWANIGLKVGEVAPSDFTQVISVPAIVVERPGRSQIQVAAPMTGIVTQVYPLEREATRPGQPLYDIRLTHEEVVTAQSDFLTQLQTLELINKELARIQGISVGVIPGKRIIEQEYKRDETLATLAALRQRLRLHGMSQVQISDIERTRQVLTKITVYAPPFANNHKHAGVEHQYHVQKVNVNRGQSVAAGELLGTLADHCLLYVEGKAFEDDANRLFEASRTGETFEAIPVSGQRNSPDQLQLKFQSVADQVDPVSRALKFYLLLPNVRLDDGESKAAKDKFVTWKYRPGQRMEVKLPTSKRLTNKIVLPTEAVVIDGPNAFIFEQNGSNFDRIDVRILYRDKDAIVLENDGQLVGSVIAMNGAFQMHLAMKNAAGGAIDPHAGHSH